MVFMQAKVPTVINVAGILFISAKEQSNSTVWLGNHNKKQVIGM